METKSTDGRQKFTGCYNHVLDDGCCPIRIEKGKHLEIFQNQNKMTIDLGIRVQCQGIKD